MTLKSGAGRAKALRLLGKYEVACARLRRLGYDECPNSWQANEVLRLAKIHTRRVSKLVTPGRIGDGFFEASFAPAWIAAVLHRLSTVDTGLSINEAVWLVRIGCKDVLATTAVYRLGGVASLVDHLRALAADGRSREGPTR